MMQSVGNCIRTNKETQKKKLTCLVVLGTYEPTTMRPPLWPLGWVSMPRSSGVRGAFCRKPMRADTNAAAVRHRKRLPFVSA